MRPEVLVLTGPTGIGKTAVAVELACQLGTEIISADSMQVYAHLSVGTAKPTPDELKGVAYHLVDHVAPGEQYNLGRFLREAEPIIARLREASRLPIVCGGTGLYLRGLLYGVFEGGGSDDEVRAGLEDRVARDGLQPLYAELMRVDPAASHIMPNDRQRILRALEIYHTTGTPITVLQTQSTAAPRYNAAVIVLDLPRAELYDRINRRVDAMLERGLLDEVRAYLAAGFSRENPALRALGYAEMIAHLEGELPLADAAAAMKQKTRNYAKRQATWFRSMTNATTISVQGKSGIEVALEIAALAR